MNISSNYPRRDSVATAPGTYFIGVPVERFGGAAFVGLQIAWRTAGFAATFTLELTSYDESDAPVSVAGAANVWIAAPGVTIAAATGAGVGASLVNVENVRQKRARLRVVVTVAGLLDVLRGNP